jgi:hypothetical protein
MKQCETVRLAIALAASNKQSPSKHMSPLGLRLHACPCPRTPVRFHARAIPRTRTHAHTNQPSLSCPGVLSLHMHMCTRSHRTCLALHSTRHNLVFFTYNLNCCQILPGTWCCTKCANHTQLLSASDMLLEQCGQPGPTCTCLSMSLAVTPSHVTSHGKVRIYSPENPLFMRTQMMSTHKSPTFVNLRQAYA